MPAVFVAVQLVGTPYHLVCGLRAQEQEEDQSDPFACEFAKSLFTRNFDTRITRTTSLWWTWPGLCLRSLTVGWTARFLERFAYQRKISLRRFKGRTVWSPVGERCQLLTPALVSTLRVRASLTRAFWIRCRTDGWFGKNGIRSVLLSSVTSASKVASCRGKLL